MTDADERVPCATVSVPPCPRRCSSIRCSAFRSFAEPGSRNSSTRGAQACEECHGGLRLSSAVGEPAYAGEHVRDAAAVAGVVIADQ